MARAVEVLVTGQVQGVSFRAYAARKAVELELVGWIRNQPDGSVLGHFEGSAEAVDSMVAWCRQGSPYAAVERVDLRDVPSTGSPEFSVEY